MRSWPFDGSWLARGRRLAPRRFELVVFLAVLLAPAFAAAAEPTTVLELFWGDGPDEVGRRGGEEAAAEGPASFAVAANGDVFVLDQTHGRVLRFGTRGERIAALELGLDTVQDIAMSGPDTLLALDHLVAGTVRAVDIRSGQLVAETPLGGDGIEETSLISALLSADDGVWVELEHASCVRILDASLQADARRARATGRALRSVDDTVVARLYKRRAVSFTVTGRDGSEPRLERAVPFEWTVDHVATVDVLPDGRWVVAAVTSRNEDQGDMSLVERRTEFVVLDEDGAQTRFLGPASLLPWTQFAEVKVGDDGGLYQMVLTETGVEVLRWAL